MSDSASTGPLAAIDVGTNSFHLVVADVRPEGGFDIVTREKIGVRLGHGGGDMKELSREAMDRGVATLTRMRQIAESHGAPVRAVATSAVREATNAEVFIERARREAGVEVEVVSGVEEGRLIHLGVLQAIPVYGTPHLVFDIGGGSTEIVVAEGHDPLLVRSFKLGAVRLTDRFFAGGRAKDRPIAECRDYVRSVLAGFDLEVAAAGFEVAIASSGTAESVLRLAHVLGGGGSLRTYNRVEQDADAIQAAVDEVVARRSPVDRSSLPGIDPARADIILAGALVLEGVVQSFGIKQLTFSEYALREGILLDTIARRGAAPLHHLRDVAKESVRHLAERCDPHPTHSAHVAALALELFDQTSLLHARDDVARSSLEAAALLANVGLVIGHSRHHLHSYYVIRNAEQLAGFTDHEIELIAQVARYHRKSAPKASHPEFQRLEAADQDLVRLLAGILRVAIGLDRSHQQHVTGVRTTRRGGVLLAEALHDPGVEVDLDVYAANDRAGLLSDVLGLAVEVRAAAR
jgi:exopolyphosphatase/guanosine-5'-triphosphate,3'-diphosphate pyrophosphatase